MDYLEQNAQDEYNSAHRNFCLALERLGRLIWSHDEIVHELELKSHLDLDLAIMEVRRRSRLVNEAVEVLRPFEEQYAYDDCGF